MEQSRIPQFTNPTDSNTFLGMNNQVVIIGLLILLILSFLGINVFIIIGNLIESFLKIIGPLITQILSIFGYTAGTVLNKSADITGDVARTGVDLAEGSLQTVGNVLRDASRKHVNNDAVSGLDNTLNAGTNLNFISNVYKEPVPSTTENPVQKPITSSKTGWCLVGEYEGKRGCVAVGEQDRCLSGQVFPSQVNCMNPTNYQGNQQ